MKEANPKLIGVFVIGGFLLAFAALFLFSSQDFFTPKRKFVAYFQQSVNGLNIGAPVRFRGIPIGEVTNIKGIFNPETGDMMPRVVLEVRPETMKNVVLQDGQYNIFAVLLKNGMRASLKSSSFLTGQLYIGLDFHPNEPVRYLGGDNDEYPEMPTVDSGLAKVIEKLSDLPVEEVLGNLAATLAAVEELLENPAFDEMLEAIPPLMETANTVLVDLDQFVTRDLHSVTQDASKTLAGLRASMEMLSTQIADESLVQINATLIEFEKTLQLARQRFSQDDPLTYELVRALREVGGAARSLRDLANYLEEHPESLLKGKAAK